MSELIHSVGCAPFAKGDQAKALERGCMAWRSGRDLLVQAFCLGPVFTLLRSRRTLPELRDSVLIHALASVDYS